MNPKLVLEQYRDANSLINFVNNRSDKFVRWKVENIKLLKKQADVNNLLVYFDIHIKYYKLRKNLSIKNI